MDDSVKQNRLQKILDELFGPRPADAPAPSAADRLSAFKEVAAEGGLPNMAPLLPMLLSLDGKPYTVIDKHFQFETLFYTRMPKNMVLKTGRQVGKSTVMSAHGIITCTSVPYFRTLYVTPLFEQVRRLSNNYVRPFIDQSPVKDLWSGTSTENSVLQRSFKNNSMMQFSFALLDADRVRGVRADKMVIDEVQDMNRDHIPIIREVMSASPWGMSQFTGTPKTPDNTIEGLWLSSSQAEWFTKCPHGGCGHWNIACTSHDLRQMIGRLRDDISERNPGTVCAKCQKVIDPKTGRWVHRYPDKRFQFAGYHIPQPIMWIHYAHYEKWAELLGKQDGIGNYTPDKFINEVLGESCGVGVQLVSMVDLQRAADADRVNDPRNPGKASVEQNLKRYKYRVLAVDWGGGGEEGISLTVCAVLGVLSSGKIEVIWARRLHTPHDHLQEAQDCLRIFKQFRCHFIAHDYTGAGTLRETFLVQTGIDVEKLIPIQYVRAATAAIMNHVKPTAIHPRRYWRVDKTRSLLTTCAAIRLGRIRFFAYDYKSNDDPGLLHDFLALTENKVETRLGSDIYTINRNPQLTDDFAQAVNIGCCALWYITKNWPSLIDNKYTIASSAANEVAPLTPDWGGAA